VQAEGIAERSTNPEPMTDSPRWERESELDPRETAPEQPDARDCTVAPQETVELDVDIDAWEDADEWEDDERRPPRLAGARESLGASLTAPRESLAATGGSLSSTAGRVGRWFASLDRRPEFDARRDPVAELTPGTDDSMTPVSPQPIPPQVPVAAAPAREGGSHTRRSELGAEEARGRFPTAALGYNRHAVDGYVAEVEGELARLREAVGPSLSITEEIERLGEQTASILVVAHDKAHETARRAQEQAARAVREAAADAERITSEAQRRLRELDEETDAVWRERERLLSDVREVSHTLATLADAASERFPAAEPGPVPGSESADESEAAATTVE
jgi:cell division septum initiation protein DivIVA